MDPKGRTRDPTFERVTSFEPIETVRGVSKEGGSLVTGNNWLPVTELLVTKCIKHT